jgi:hypothetical protein
MRMVVASIPWSLAFSGELPITNSQVRAGVCIFVYTQESVIYTK